MASKPRWTRPPAVGGAGLDHPWVSTLCTTTDSTRELRFQLEALLLLLLLLPPLLLRLLLVLVLLKKYT